MQATAIRSSPVRVVPPEVVFAGVVQAGSVRVAVVAGDVLLVLVVGGTAGWWDWRVGVAAAVLTAAWLTAMVAGTGVDPARRAAGVRTVDRVSGLPAGWACVVPGRTVDVDVRAGRDPVQVCASDVVSAPRGADPWAVGASRAGVVRAVLLVDDGTRVLVTGPVVLGRRPGPLGAGWVGVELTDLSRTVSRNHLSVVPVPGGVQVADLGSANGTRVAVAVSGGRVGLLPDNQQVVVGFGAVLDLGERQVRVLDPGVGR